MKIGFLLPHKHLTGGMKMLLEYLKVLSRRGHQIVTIFRDNDEKLPEWYSGERTTNWRHIAVPREQPLHPFVSDLDVLVVGFFTQLGELQELPVPTVLFEQGSEFLFGDYGDLSPHAPVRMLLSKTYTTPPIIAVSHPLRHILEVRFGRKALVVPKA